MKKARIILGWILILLLCAGCSGSGTKVATPTIEYPAYCSEFLEVVGQDMDTVLAAMGLTVADLQNEGSWYVLTKPVEYLGHTFEMRLNTVAINADSRYVHSVVYLLYDETPEAGVQTVTDLRDQLLEGYGPAYNAPKYSNGNYGVEETNPPSPLNTLDQTALLEQFTKEDGYSTGMEWLLSTDVGQLPEETASMWRGESPTCITGELVTAYPAQEDGKNVVLTKLTYGLSRSYRK